MSETVVANCQCWQAALHIAKCLSCLNVYYGKMQATFSGMGGDVKGLADLISKKKKLF